MIKNTELQIGDWVSCDGKNYQIAEVGGMVCIEAEKELFASFGDIEPIPLTPAILFKNFPEGDEVAWWPSGVKINDEDTLFHCEVSGYFIGVKGEFRYIHQLQHALRLCGIDKTIEL